MRGSHPVRASQRPLGSGPSPFPDRPRRAAPCVKPSSAPLVPSAVGTHRSGAGAETAASLDLSPLGSAPALDSDL